MGGVRYGSGLSEPRVSRPASSRRVWDGRIKFGESVQDEWIWAQAGTLDHIGCRWRVFELAHPARTRRSPAAGTAGKRNDCPARARIELPEHAPLARTPVRVGDRLNVGFEVSRAVWFDAQTGFAL